MKLSPESKEQIAVAIAPIVYKQASEYCWPDDAITSQIKHVLSLIEIALLDEKEQ